MIENEIIIIYRMNPTTIIKDALIFATTTTPTETNKLDD